MDLVTDYWQQLLFVLSVVVISVKLNASVAELKKDVEEITKRDTYIETTKLRAQVDMHEKQISALWTFINNLRDRFNGHSK
ncbi:hypothetical protein CMO96_00450 [Candidatus Woesebacteria bacterium]|nr:hypothetical protein [Candidatus Woesebacteria bacterium]|tara:strand:- start:330 stop:572 length:243 start_codon:yes stop_codon:yes gene_type:complete